MNPIFIIPFIFYFILAAIIAFYIPGRILLGQRYKISSLGIIACSVILGVVLFSAQGFIFGFLGMRFLTYIYLLTFVLIFVIKKYYKEIFSFKFSIEKLTFLLILIGIIAQIIPYVFIGLKTNNGVITPYHNAPDHIWHATLVAELVRRFPPYEPAIAGVLLTDYHYWFNLATAELIRIFHLPLLPTQFLGMYTLASLLLGAFGYLLGNLFFHSKATTKIFLFFLFFSGDAAGWVTFIFQHTFNWGLASLINDSSKFLESPPFSYSLVIFFAGMYLLFQDRKISWRTVILCVLLFGSSVPFKVYTGIVVFGGLGLWTCYQLLKRNGKALALLIGAVALGALVFLKVSSGGGGLFFLPVDIPRDFINQPALGLVNWQFRWVIFQQHHNLLRLIQYGIYMSAVYFLTQFGILLLGIIPTRKTIEQLDIDKILFLYGSLATSFIMGLFFYQKVGGANIWEFFLPAIFILSITASQNIHALLENKKIYVKTAVYIILFILIIPRFILSMQSNITEQFFSGFHGITNEELTSYDYIKNNTSQNSVILIENQANYHIYSWYASIFMQRDLFLSGEGVRQIITPTIWQRRGVIKIIQNSKNAEEINQLLQKNHISYIYFYGIPRFGLPTGDLAIHSAFSNKFATIFTVNPQ